MQTLDQKILRSVRATKRAFAFSVKDFASFGSSSAIRKALERLNKRQDLRRIRRGFYDLPHSHPLLGKTAPDPMDLVRGMMKDSSARWQVSGAYAANLLQLSDQVPAKIVILTDGGSRRVQLDHLTIEFRRAAPRYLLGAGKPAGLIFQALRHLGISGITPKVVSQLRHQLDTKTKAELKSFTPHLPAWMRPSVQEITRP